MADFVDSTAFNHEQGNRARKLFAAVVLAALDDAINTATVLNRSHAGRARATVAKFCPALASTPTNVLLRV